MEDKIDEEKYIIDDTQIETSIIDDEILNQRVEPLRQKMKNGEISFDEYTNQYNKLYLERYNEIKSNQEENIHNYKSNISDTKRNKHNILLILAYIFLICCIAGIIFVYIAHKLRMQKEYNNTGINSAITYKCPDEYELVNNKCYKVVDTTNANIDYSCNDGYNLSNDKCIRTEYSNNFVTDWTCPDGYVMGKERYPDVCYKKTTISTEMVYYCKPGYSNNGNKCTKTISTYANAINSCYAGAIYNPNDGLCHLLAIVTNCNYPWRISGGSARGGYTCVHDPIVVYECPSNTTKNGRLCYSTEEYNAEIIYQCPDGTWDINSDRTQCTKTFYEVPKYETRCGTSGYTLKDKYCVKTITIEANKKAYCNEEYELKDNNCIKYDIQEPIIIEE